MRTIDLFILAGAVLSVVIVISGAFARWMLRDGGAEAFLFVAIVVIGCTAAGAWWLKRIAAEERT